MDEKKLQKELAKYIDNFGRIIDYRSKRHRMIRPYIYAALTSHFESDKKYTEKEVNEIIKYWILFEDYVLLRRELVDYHYLDRTSDGRSYWRV